MPRYKPTDYSQGQFIPIQFERQILPGSFEYALNYVVDHKVDFTLLDGRRENDEAGAPAYNPRVMDASGDREPLPGRRKREEKAIESMEAKVSKIDDWLRENPEDKKGKSGQPVKSSMTDADSAKLVSSHGVIQGYNGLAAVDSKHQVIVAAEAFGKGNDAELRLRAGQELPQEGPGVQDGGAA